MRKPACATTTPTWRSLGPSRPRSSRAKIVCCHDYPRSALAWRRSKYAHDGATRLGERAVSSSCPACGSSRRLEFFRREAVPIHQHLLHSSAAEARSAPRGALDLARCEDCAFVWNRAFRPELLTYVPGYDNDASGSARFRRHTGDRIEAILADPIQGRSILEIGCGSGAFLRRLCRRGGNRGIGLDPALVPSPGDEDDRVELRREAFHAGERLPSAQIIVCRHLIEHLAEPVSLVRAIARALGAGPGGVVYLETPSLEWIVDHDAF